MGQEPLSVELINAIASLGTPGAALFAACYLARELRGMTTRMIDTMTSTIEKNTETLAKVEAVILNCQRPNHR